MGSLDLNHSTPRPIDISAPMSALLDWAVVKKQKDEYDATRGKGDNSVAYKRIGAGYVGTPCLRELAYRFHKYPKDPLTGEEYPKGQLARHAAAGHWAEEHMAEIFRYAGFDLSTYVTDEQGNPVMDYRGAPKQHGYMSAPNSQGKFQLAGELDGVFWSGPKELPKDLPEEARVELDKLLNGGIQFPANWESKKASDKKFKKFVKDGVKKAAEVYYAQVQIGLAYTGRSHAIFSMLNFDTMELYVEIIPFNLEDAQRYNDRAVQVLKTDTPDDAPRLTKKPDDFRCQFCEYKRTHCWADHFNPVQRRLDTDGTDTSLPWNGVPVWGNAGQGVDGTATIS